FFLQAEDGIRYLTVTGVQTCALPIYPLLSLMHKPDPALPADEQDKRSVIPIERKDWDTWLNGSIDEAMALVKLPGLDLFSHGAADPAQDVPLPVKPSQERHARAARTRLH